LGAEEHALLAERAEVGDLAARDVEHRARRIDRDQPAALAHPAEDLDRRVAGAARDGEHLPLLRHREVAQEHLPETRPPHRRDLVIVDTRELLDLERALRLDRHNRAALNCTEPSAESHSVSDARARSGRGDPLNPLIIPNGWTNPGSDV